MTGVFDHREAFAGDIGPNLFLNPDFEANTFSWSAGGGEGNTVTRASSPVHTGAWSLSVGILAGSPNGTVECGSIGDDALGVQPLVPGAEYRLGIWVRAALGKDLTLRDGTSAPGGIHPEAAFSPVPFVGTGDWQLVSAGPFVSGDGNLFPIIQTSGPTTFEIDDAHLSQAELTQPIPIYRGSRIAFPPGEMRLAIKLRAGDSDVEDDRLTDFGDDPIETIRVYHRPAFASLSDALES